MANIIYEFYNKCIGCKIIYPKIVIRCGRCKKPVRTRQKSTSPSKQRIRERMVHRY